MTPRQVEKWIHVHQNKTYGPGFSCKHARAAMYEVLERPIPAAREDPLDYLAHVELWVAIRNSLRSADPKHADRIVAAYMLLGLDGNSK